MIRIVNLNPNEPNVSKKYNKGDIVFCLCDCTNAAFTSYLPDAQSADDLILVYKKTDSTTNAVTGTPINSQTVDGSSTFTLNTQYDTVVIVSDGSNWHKQVRKLLGFEELTLGLLNIGTYILMANSTWQGVAAAGGRIVYVKNV
jgi:predicted  nucleic acid-binding Zn-ribbon protein